ncbi:MAG: mercury transport protein [Acidimicrobiales bacterium]|nr:mercury transport protein [Acidimicrobiales bacterium]
MEQIRTRIAAFVTMALCCGLVMAVALGAVTLTGAWLAGGVIALVVAGCVGTAAWVAVKARHAPAVDSQ